MPDTNSISIKNWSQDDRPREKLIALGRSALSNAELLAILIGSGSRELSAVALSRLILNDVKDSLNDLGKLNVNELMQYKGIGEAKAITIIAATELGRRRRAEMPVKKPVISSSKSAFDILLPLIGELPHEEFWILYLNNSNKLISKIQLSKGGMTGTLVDQRIVFKAALELGATGMILAHNHPSGKLQPSQKDKEITEKMARAGQTLDIKVLDHLIVTEHGYYSFADQGII